MERVRGVRQHQRDDRTHRGHRTAHLQPERGHALHRQRGQDRRDVRLHDGTEDQEDER